MPLMNLNPAARQRHQIRVITIGFFRVLKSMKTSSMLRTKLEVVALTEFLQLLEKLKEADTGSDGVILVFHEARKFIPYMIIEAMKKYNLLPRFLATVKSMVNTNVIAVEKLGKPIKFLALRQIVKEILNIDDNSDSFEGNAAVRAKMAYKIVEQIARDNGVHQQEDTGDLKVKAKTEVQLAPEELKEKLRTIVHGYADSIDSEFSDLKEQEFILQRQNTFRPVFLQYFRATLRHRVKAVNFRRVLAENGYDLEQLKAVWNDTKRDGINNIISKFSELKEDDQNELCELLDNFFDPEKESIKPKVHHNPRRSNRNYRPRIPGGNGNRVGQNNYVNGGAKKNGKGSGNNHGASGQENVNGNIQNNSMKENVKPAVNNDASTQIKGVKGKNEMSKPRRRRSFQPRNNNHGNNRTVAAAN